MLRVSEINSNVKLFAKTLPERQEIMEMVTARDSVSSARVKIRHAHCQKAKCAVRSWHYRPIGSARTASLSSLPSSLYLKLLLTRASGEHKVPLSSH